MSGTKAPRNRFRALVLAGATLLLGGALAVGATSYASAVPDKLQPGEGLKSGATMKSANGKYLFAMQTDGNLVLYSGKTPLWSSQTAGNRGASAIMQRDGNFVIYSAARKALWSTRSTGSGAFLAVQNDANVVVYKSDKPLWDRVSTTFTLRPGDVLETNKVMSSPNGRHKLVMQSDGNLVLYSGKTALWSSNTYGKGGTRLEMQHDGNLVMYTAAHRPVWHTSTGGNPGAFFQVQNDDNLVVYSATKRPLWDRH